MKLNVYNKKEIVKTYEADTYDLMFGTMEDVIATLDLDGLQTGSEIEMVKVAANVVVNNIDTVRDLMKDIFDGITDEELRNVKVKDMARVLVEIVTYMIAQIKITNNGKK